MPDSNGVEIASQYVGHPIPGRNSRPSRHYATMDDRCGFEEEAKPNVIAPQGKDESNADFRARVAGVLREAGMIVDAHEAYSNRYHHEKAEDGQPGDAAMGIVGHIALALASEHSRPRGVGQSGGSRDFDDEIVLGHLEQAGALRKPSQGEADAMLMLVMAMGGSR